MNAEPSSAPPAIGGWLILVGYRLLSQLGVAFIYLVAIIAGYVSTSSLFTVAISAGITGFCAYLFFGRIKQFKVLFAVLTGITLTIFLIGTIMIPNKSYSWESLPSILFLAIDIVCVVYLFLSKRAKKTFVFEGNAQDPTIRLGKNSPAENPTEPMPIYGLLILIGALLVTNANSALSEVLDAMFNPGTQPALTLLLDVALLLLSIFCILLFFNRKTLFKWIFIGIMGICVVLNVILLIEIFNDKSIDLNSAGPQILVPVIIYISSIIYIFKSKRVKRTFVFGMRPERKFEAGSVTDGSSEGGDVDSTSDE